MRVEETHGVEDHDDAAVPEEGRPGDPERPAEGLLQRLDDDAPRLQGPVDEERLPPAAAGEVRPARPAEAKTAANAMIVIGFVSVSATALA